MYNVYFTKSSQKELNKINKIDAKRVITKLQKLIVPFPKNFDIKPITGHKNYYRLRIGKIRIIFEVLKNKQQIWIRKIDYRSGVYMRY